MGSNLVAQVAERIRAKGMLPPSEVNDSLILAESAALSAAFLLTSDEHLRGIDLQQLTLVLQSFDLRVPVVTTPSEVVRKFFR
ncbi:MAG: hypothetical protein HYZ36_00365 [Pedosphaera parvula]|nr:hypothetical protein [Pedosphaera parvula]